MRTPSNPALLGLLCAGGLALLCGDVDARPELTRIAGVHYLGDAPTRIADERGHFADHGLRVEVTYSATGKHNLQRLRAGEADFALMAPTPLVLDRVARAGPPGPDDPVILANLARVTGLNRVVVPAAGPIRRPADLVGQRIGLPAGTGAEFAWWLFAQYHGLEPGQVSLVRQPVTALPHALASGSVDGALMWAPWPARVRAAGTELRVFRGGELYTGKWLLVARRRTCNSDPGRCRAVLGAYRDAIDFIQRHPRQALALLAAHAGLEPEALGESWDPLSYDLTLDWAVLSTLQQQMDWARQTRAPMHGRTPDILPLLAPAPLRAIAPAVVGVPRVGAAAR